jgi:hypothetical protein
MTDETIEAADTGGTPLTGDERLTLSMTSRTVSLEALATYVAIQNRAKIQEAIQEYIDENRDALVGNSWGGEVW